MPAQRISITAGSVPEMASENSIPSRRADDAAALSCAAPTVYDGSSCALEAAAVRSESSEGLTSG